MVPSALTTGWWDVWTTLTAIVLVSSFWAPLANAATPTTNLKSRAPIADGIDLRVLPIGEYVLYFIHYLRSRCHTYTFVTHPLNLCTRF